MAKKETNVFEALNSVDVSEYTKKKGKYNYLSWCYAVQELLKVCPTATWEIHIFKGQDGADQPYMKNGTGAYVQVSVNVEGIIRTQVHPVLDNRNNAIKEPNSFQINTSIQRCLAKAIALHGLGLYIFAGEDLPEDNKPEPIKVTTTQKKEIDELLEIAPLTPEEKDGTIKWIGKVGRTEREADDLIKKLNSKISPTSQTNSVKIGDVVDGVANSGATN